MGLPLPGQHPENPKFTKRTHLKKAKFAMPDCLKPGRKPYAAPTPFIHWIFSTTH
jgi:hypothetical protein